MTRIQYFLVLLLSISCLLSINLKAQRTIKKTAESWTILIDGKPFEIKGVTFGYDKEVHNYSHHFKDLNSLGVNTIRIWATNENTMTLLDSADAYGIKVMVGIWMRHGKPGMEADDSFNYLEDKNGMEDMYENAISTVEKYKNHPAVLTWAVGNEVYLNIATDEEKEVYSLLLERICAKIKKLDSDHPITSVDAWDFGLDWWQKFVPSLDILGINCYGPGANIFPEELKKRGIDMPYVITEFGVTGEWDSGRDKNGIEVEPSDQQKYDAIAIGYHQWIINKPSCLGVYFFHYGDGGQFTSPWLFTHYKGMYRPQYWAIREAYTTKTPINMTPVIQSFELPKKEPNSGAWMPVTLTVSDLEEEELTFSFNYNQRTGSRQRRDQINPLKFRGNIRDGFEIQMPEEHGAIKIYVNVADTYNNVGIASTSIVVVDEKAKTRKYLVAKASLPFYVYKEGKETPYIPSGYMGNIEAIGVDLNHKDDFYSGSTALKISYNARDNWYGVCFVDPPNDWGDKLGGFDLSGAKKFSFWAKADDDNVKAEIGFGLIGADRPFPDTAKKSTDIILTTEWKRYSMNIKKLDLSCIRTGLFIVSSSHGFPHNIFLDNVVFE